MANEGSNDLIQFDGGALVADMVADVTADHALELSQYALEDGASINDHAVQQPKRLSLVLVQTESPLTAVQGFRQVSQALQQRVRTPDKQSVTVNVPQKEFRPTSLLALSDGVRSALFGRAPSTLSFTALKTGERVDDAPLKVTVLAADADVGRVNEFHEQLVALLESVTPVQITFKQRQYDAMVITSVSRNDAAGQFGSARFTVQLQQISTAETRIVDLPPVPQATAKVDKGKKDGKDADTSAKRKTLAAALADAGNPF